MVTTTMMVGMVIVSCADSPEDAPDINPDGNVVITSPQGGAVISGTVKVKVEVKGLGEVKGVEFYVGDDRVDSDIFPPFELDLDTTAYPDGALSLTAQAAGSNNRTGSASVDVTVDNTPPSVELVSPLPESLIFFEDGGIDIELAVTDTLGVSDVTLMANGQRLTATESTDTHYKYHVAWEQIAISRDVLPRAVTLAVTAVDAINQESQQLYHLTVTTRFAWSFPTLGEIWAAPAFDPLGNTYVGSQDGTMYVFDANGVVQGRWATGSPISFDSTFDHDGNLVIPSGNTVQSWSPSGTLNWSYDFGHAVNSPAVSANGLRILVGTYAPGLSALDTSTGTPMWNFATSQPVLSSPATDPSGAVYFGCHDGNVYSLDDGGGELWRFATGDEVWSNPLVTANSDLVFGSNNGTFFRVNRYKTEQWRYSMRSEMWGGTVEGSDGTLYFGTVIRGLHALSASGEELWVTPTGGVSQSTPALGTDGTIYIGSALGELQAYNSDGTPRFTFSANATIHGSPGVSPDGSLVVFGSSDQSVYAIRTGAEPEQGCGDPEMVVVNGIRVMAYEASRADATESEEGTRTDRVCSTAGVKPWVRATWEEARNACMTAGMDLCPEAIWQSACSGPGGTDFPYGDTYQPGLCYGNGEHQYGCAVGGSCEPAPTGSLESCKSPSGAYDASGNVREWVLQGEECCRFVRGGSFRDSGDDLRCSNTIPDTHKIPAESRLDDVGFRCCSAQ